MEIVLPKKKILSEKKSPKNLIIFSKPKVGKTSLLAELDNCLLIDLEDGSDYVDAMKIKASSVEDLQKIGKQIIAEGYPYEYIAIDTITALETLCIPYAELLYARTSMGKNWFKRDANGGWDKNCGKSIYGNILNLPNGGGYGYLRQGFTKITEYLKSLAPRVIFCGHVKDIMLEKNGSEFNSSDLDLTGKIKRIMSSQSDAIAYLYRKGNTNIMSFKTSDEVSCGARPDHLKNQEFVISEMTDKGFKTNWDKIYID